ncbi:MAG: VCBS repeat-containing protein [Nannocystaceae bacterium]|nr:VCBS repeat-containing protein [Nannocystaceae bacterium]
MRRANPYGFVLLALTAGCFNPTEQTPDGDTDGPETSSSTAADPSNPSESATGTSAGSMTAADGTSTGSTTSSASTGEQDSTSDDGSTDTGSSSSGESQPLLCGDGIAAPGEVCFDDASVLNAGDIGYSPRVGDVNSNGNVDLVYLYGDQVVVRLGDGAGGFGPELTDETLYCDQMELVDVNGDGDLDVVGTSMFDDFLTVALGTGTGSFTLQATSTILSGNPVQLVAGNLTGDNNPDVVSIHGTAFGGTGGARVLAADGMGGFSSSDFVSTGSAAGRDVALGDFTGDGVLDVVLTIATGTSQVRIAVNNGAGQFGQSLVVNTTTSDASGVATGDFNDDGDDDIVVGNGPDVLVLLGTGAAAFENAVSLSVAAHATRVAVADVTNDGIDDIIAVYDNAATVSVFPSAGDGTFGERVDFTIGAASDSLSTGDVNDDGIPDLVVGSTSDELITVLISTP